MTTLKTKIQSVINADQCKAWLDHLNKLVMQGDLLRFPIQKSQISQGATPSILSLAESCALPSMHPTFQNLKLWGKKMSANCKLCENTQTVLHVLAGCKTMLEQGRGKCIIYQCICILYLCIFSEHKMNFIEIWPNKVLYMYILSEFKMPRV